MLLKYGTIVRNFPFMLPENALLVAQSGISDTWAAESAVRLGARGSGGKGKHNGGDGVTRRIEFLEDMSVGILSGRRTTRPYGLNGGEPGEPGRNRLYRGGEVRDLDAHVRLDVREGDIIEINTPGGGAYGAEPARS